MTSTDQIAQLRAVITQEADCYAADTIRVDTGRLLQAAEDALALAEELAQRLEETKCANVSDQTDD